MVLNLNIYIKCEVIYLLRLHCFKGQLWIWIILNSIVFFKFISNYLWSILNIFDVTYSDFIPFKLANTDLPTNSPNYIVVSILQ